MVKMKDKNNIYLDLRKLSEEEIKQIPKILEDAGDFFVGIATASNMLHNNLNQYQVFAHFNRFKLTCERFAPKDKTEVTFSEFLELFQPKQKTLGRNQNLFNFLSKELDVTILESQVDDLFHAIKQDGYFIFPKADEGDFPDLRGFEGVEMEASDSGDWSWISETNPNIICKVNGRFLTKNGYTWSEVRLPIQKQEITLSELFQKAGLEQEKFNLIHK